MIGGKKVLSSEFEVKEEAPSLYSNPGLFSFESRLIPFFAGDLAGLIGHCTGKHW
jgi:hypothetical protein